MEATQLGKTSQKRLTGSDALIRWFFKWRGMSTQRVCARLLTVSTVTGHEQRWQLHPNGCNLTFRPPPPPPCSVSHSRTNRAAVFATEAPPPRKNHLPGWTRSRCRAGPGRSDVSGARRRLQERREASGGGSERPGGGEGGRGWVSHGRRLVAPCCLLKGEPHLQPPPLPTHTHTHPHTHRDSCRTDLQPAA